MCCLQERFPWTRTRELVAHGCRLASALSGRFCDDAEVVAGPSPRAQRAMLGSEGQAHGVLSVLLLSLTCVPAARMRGPGCFPSQLAGPPQMAAPGHQGDRVGPRLPADGTGALAVPVFPPGQEQTGAGLRHHTPEWQPHPP